MGSNHRPLRCGRSAHASELWTLGTPDRICTRTAGSVDRNGICSTTGASFPVRTTPLARTRDVSILDAILVPRLPAGLAPALPVGVAGAGAVRDIVRRQPVMPTASFATFPRLGPMAVVAEQLAFVQLLDQHLPAPVQVGGDQIRLGGPIHMIELQFTRGATPHALTTQIGNGTLAAALHPGGCPGVPVVKLLPRVLHMGKDSTVLTDLVGIPGIGPGTSGLSSRCSPSELDTLGGPYRA